MKVALNISYDGSRFLGSQSQPHKNSVEDELKLALNHVGIFDAPIMSSRTDKGVHALSQVVSVRIGEFWNKRLKHLKNQINKHLHPAIRLKSIKIVNDNFHARYDAKARRYRYIISHKQLNAFNSAYLSYFESFDINMANNILKCFIGEHDFSSFMKVGSNSKSSIRYVKKAFCYKFKDYSVITFVANGFLRSQVRLMVSATIKALSLPEQAAKNAILSQLNNTKQITRIPAPPNGLYLARVHYF